MFSKACARIRNTIYGLNGLSQIAQNQVNCTNATGFMISPGVIATACHFIHVENDPAKPIHTVFELIRTPDIGQKMETAVLIAHDPVRDIALLRINNPRSKECVKLNINTVPLGTVCGSLGFPLANVVFSQTGRTFNLVERFQGANISAYYMRQMPGGQNIPVYETDALMYNGSSGCPGFTEDKSVFGMHVASAIANPQAGNNPQNRLAISIWVPSTDIIAFAASNGIAV